MEPIRILIADDHPALREGLRAILSREAGLVVVAEAGTGPEAVALAQEHKPHVVLMDVRMPELDGISATRRIRETCPQSAVIIFTIYDNEAFIVDAIRAGAAGYLVKDASPTLLVHTIRAVRSGGTLIKSALLREAMTGLLEPPPHYGATRPAGRASMELTPRERSILPLMVEGQTNQEIGARLGVSPETVKKHIQSILLKLQAADRTQAAAKALRLGLVD